MKRLLLLLLFVFVWIRLHKQILYTKNNTAPVFIIHQQPIGAMTLMDLFITTANIICFTSTILLAMYGDI